MIREAICKHLMLLCEASGLSQQAFAKQIGVTPQALSNYFSYIRTPPHALIYRVCEVCNASPADFYPPVVATVRRTQPAQRAKGSDRAK